MLLNLLKSITGWLSLYSGFEFRISHCKESLLTNQSNQDITWKSWNVTKKSVPLPGHRSVEHAPPTRSFQYNATTARSVVSSIPKLKNSEIGQAWRHSPEMEEVLQQKICPMSMESLSFFIVMFISLILSVIFSCLKMWVREWFQYLTTILFQTSDLHVSTSGQHSTPWV